jgi:hypothetical protein
MFDPVLLIPISLHDFEKRIDMHLLIQILKKICQFFNAFLFLTAMKNNKHHSGLWWWSIQTDKR